MNDPVRASKVGYINCEVIIDRINSNDQEDKSQISQLHQDLRKLQFYKREPEPSPSEQEEI